MSVNPVLGKVAVTVWTFNKFLTLWRRIGFYMRHSSFSTMYWIASRHREIRLGFAGSTTHDVFSVSAGVQTWFAIAIWSNNKVTQFIDIFCWGRQACLQKVTFADGDDFLIKVQKQSAFRKAIFINTENDCFSYQSLLLMPKYSTYEKETWKCNIAVHWKQPALQRLLLHWPIYVGL